MKYLALTLLSLGTCVQAQDSVVLAKMGEIELRPQEIRETISGLNAEQRAAIAKDPAVLGQYVRALLVQRVVLKEAAAQQLDQDPAVIAKLVRAREMALSECFLEKVSDPGPDYPNDAELSDAYEIAKPKLIVAKSYHLAHIYIANDKAKLDSALKLLKEKNADFTSIAKKMSDESSSAAKGGEIGWLTLEQIQPEIREVLPKLSLGEVSSPVTVKDGWHLMKVLDIREPFTPTLDQIRPTLTARLRADRAQQKRQDYLAQLVKNHPVAINEIGLNQLTQKP
jgi:parvulin-like peptidyl-prolyl isomerase